jgi:hypothetical protein
MRRAIPLVGHDAGSDTDAQYAARMLNLFQELLSSARHHIAYLQTRNDQLEAARANSFPSIPDLARAARNPDAKNKVLDAMPIIATPLAANLLGVPERELRLFVRQTGGLFGRPYDGRWCHSLNELQVFVQNPGWFETKPGDFNVDSARAHLHLRVRVHADIARAYLNLDAIGLRAALGQRSRFCLGEMYKVLAAQCAGVAND